jgi:hypothetical protein
MEAGIMGDNIDLRRFVPRAVIFDHIGGIVERKVHHRRIVPVDPDGNAMYFAGGREGGRGERHRCERNSRHRGKPCTTVLKRIYCGDLK